MTVYEAVPDRLRERDRWVCWTYEMRDGDETKPPIAPFDGGLKGKYASTGDPETWRSFDEAIEYHKRDDTDTEGVGYALGDEDLVAGADLDGCRLPETGEIEPWAEDIIDRLDSYTEISPSGTGFRVFVFALMPAGGNRKSQPRSIEALDEYEKDSEVEMYDTGRYLTFTGDHIEATPTTVEQRNDAFADVHAEYIAEDEDDNQTTLDETPGTEDAPDLDLDDEEILEKARNAKNGDKFRRLEQGADSMHSGDTSAADQAFVNHLAFWTGGDRQQMDRLFRDSDRMRSKWDEDRGDKTYGELTINTALKKQTEFYAPNGGGPSNDTPEESGDGETNDGGLPKPSDFTVKEGCYGYYTRETDSEGEPWSKWHEAATFQLNTRSFIIEDGGATVTVELTVHPASDEPPYDVTVPIDAFTEPRKFRRKVATGRTTTYDLGTSFLNKIRRFVGDQDAPIRTPTRQIGLHDGEFVTPDGVLTADGWSDDPDTILVDNDTTVPQKWALDPEAGVDYDCDAVVNILETLPQTRESERFLPVLGWFYAAALRPLIMEWSGEFNILNITGDTGAGKTATLSMLWQLFGMDGEPLSTTGTSFTRLTAFSSSNAVPVWFDEFKPAEMSEYQQDTFMSLLRKSTRGGTEPKGNADQTEDQWHLRAPTVVTGEQLVSGPAEERRSIQTVFTTAVTDEDSEEFRHFARLSGGYYVDDGETVYCDEPNLADHARAYYTWLLNRVADEEDTLEQEWQRAGERVTTLLAGADMSVHPTVKHGFQTILFGCWLYRGLCEALGADARAAGVTDESVLQAILTTAETGTGSEHVSHLDRLLGLAARAAAADYLEEGEHYKLVVPQDGTDDDEELRLKLATAFDEIRRYARDHDVQDGDLLDAAHDYRLRIQDAEDDASSVVAASSVKTYELNRTCAFSVTTATNHIEDFERSMFAAVSDERNAADDDGVTAIEDLSPGQYVTIEAMAASVLDPAPWLAGEGTFSDDSGRIDYVVRGEVETGIEQGAMHRLTDVKVTTDDDGMTILEIRGGTTGVEAIGPKASEQHTVTETAETDGGSTTASSADDAMPPEDAQGAAADAARLVILIDDLAGGEMQREGMFNAAKARFGWRSEQTKAALDHGLRNGALIEPETNLIRTA